MKRIATIVPVALAATFALSSAASAATPYDKVEVGQTRHAVHRVLDAKPHVIQAPWSTGHGQREVIYYHYAPTSFAFVTFFKPRGYNHFVVIAKTTCETGTADGPICT